MVWLPSDAAPAPVSPGRAGDWPREVVLGEPGLPVVLDRFEADGPDSIAGRRVTSPTALVTIVVAPGPGMPVWIVLTGPVAVTVIVT